MASLVFEKDSLLNTKVRLRLANSESTSTDAEVYEISTRLPGSSTQIFRHTDGNRTVVGSINRKMFLPNTVSFPGLADKKAERITKWLEAGALVDGSPALVLHLGGEATYLANHDGYNLALFGADQKTILAHWQPKTQFSPLALVVSAGVDLKHHIEILMAFLLQSEKLRAKTPMDAKTAGTGLMLGPGMGNAP